VIINHAIQLLGREIALKPIEKILEDYKHAPFDEVLDLIIKDRLSMLEKQQALLTIILKEIQYHTAIETRIMAHIYCPARQLFSDFYKHQVTIGNVRHFDSTEQLFQTLTTILIAPIARRLIVNQVLVPSELEAELSAIKDIILRGVTC
jgi:hypothetical protein